MIPGVHPPRGGGGWVDGGGIGYGCVGGCPMHARMHTHTRTYVKHVVNMINMDASMLAAICNFYTCINVHVCVCMHACACACVWGHPPIPPDAPPPTCPLPRAIGSPKHQNSISPELIEIIQFCLKICDHWTFLHTYRLGLMCRWGGVLSQMALLCFWLKKVLLWPSNKKFSCFCIGSH